MPKYVIDGFFITQKITGTQRYSYEIIMEMDKLVKENFIEILVPEYTEKLPVYQNIRIVKYGRHKGLLWQQIDMVVYLRHQKAKGIYLNNVIPLFYPKGIIVLYDICYKVNPQFYQSLRDKLSMYWHRLHYRVITRSKMKIVTNSEFSKSEIIKYYAVEAERIHVVYSAWQHMDKIHETEDIFERFPQLKPKQFYFSMSSLSANKNFKWVLNAAKNNPKDMFVIAGGGKLQDAAETMGFVDLPNVQFLGYVSDEDAKAMMRNCKAFLFPTLYEGFGLPPLEAISCGATAIVSDTCIMHEIYGDSVGYVDPHDSCIDFEKCIKEDANKTGRILARYSWEKSAYAFLDIVEE